MSCDIGLTSHHECK